ncbi:hypothetical protein [Micromonospora sp. NPDC049891]|uniref:hypothetical protein n=1 Tax=Micromonospora sp. NPDC049891 TaxID=3155655 RepID=UPI0033E38DEB
MGCALLLLQTAFPAGDAGYAAIALLAPVGYLASAALARFSFARLELGPDGSLPHRPGLAGEAVAVVRGMADGIRHLGRARGAAYAMVAQAGFRLLFGVLALAMLLLYRNRFAGDDLDGVPAQLGLVFAAGAGGVLLAAAVTPAVARRVGGWRWVVGLLAAVAVALPVFGLPFDPLLLVAVVLVVNVAGHGITIVVDTSAARVCRRVPGAGVRGQRHDVQSRLRARHGGRVPVHPGRRAFTGAARCRRGRLRVPRGSGTQLPPAGGLAKQGRHRPVSHGDAGRQAVARRPRLPPVKTTATAEGAAVAVVCRLTRAAPCAGRVSS